MVWKNVDTGIESSCIKVLHENGKFIAVFQYNYIVILDENNPFEASSTVNISNILNSSNIIELRDVIFVENSYYITAWDIMSNIGYILYTDDLVSFNTITIERSFNLYGVYPNGNNLYLYCEDSEFIGMYAYKRLSLYSVPINNNVCSVMYHDDNKLTIDPVNCEFIKEFISISNTHGTTPAAKNITIFNRLRKFFIQDGALIVVGEIPTSSGTSTQAKYPTCAVYNLFRNPIYLPSYSGQAIYMVNAITVNGGAYILTYYSYSSSSYEYRLYKFDLVNNSIIKMYPVDDSSRHSVKDSKFVYLNCAILLSGKYLMFHGGNAYFTQSLEYLIDNLSNIESFRVSSNMILSVAHNYKYIVAGGENGNLIVAAIS